MIGGLTVMEVYYFVEKGGQESVADTLARKRVRLFAVGGSLALAVDQGLLDYRFWGHQSQRMESTTMAR